MSYLSIRDCITDFYRARLALKEKVLVPYQVDMQIRMLKESSPCSVKLFLDGNMNKIFGQAFIFLYQAQIAT